MRLSLTLLAVTLFDGLAQHFPATDVPTRGVDGRWLDGGGGCGDARLRRKASARDIANSRCRQHPSRRLGHVPALCTTTQSYVANFAPLRTAGRKRDVRSQLGHANRAVAVILMLPTPAVDER